MSELISLVNAKKYYKYLPHQIEAIEYLGKLLLSTPAAKTLQLINSLDWIRRNDTQLLWLELQLSKTTLEKFALLYRNSIISSSEELQVKYYSQRDNSIKPLVTCNSSSHAMFIDYYLRKNNLKGLNTDNQVIDKVFSGKYGTYGSNSSVSWDVQVNVAKSFGINCKYSNKGKQSIIDILSKGGICPFNIYQKGTTKFNRGGGHVVVGVDYDKSKGFYIYDPYGSRPPSYSQPSQGKYWMSEQEFNWRHGGIHTVFLSLM
jgi:hypothetical protein